MDIIKSHSFVFRIRTIDDVMYTQLHRDIISDEGKRIAVSISEIMRRCEKLCRQISPPDYSGL